MLHLIINERVMKAPEVHTWVRSHLIGGDHHTFHEGGCVWMQGVFGCSLAGRIAYCMYCALNLRSRDLSYCYFFLLSIVTHCLLRLTIYCCPLKPKGENNWRNHLEENPRGKQLPSDFKLSSHFLFWVDGYSVMFKSPTLLSTTY